MLRSRGGEEGGLKTDDVEIERRGGERFGRGKRGEKDLLVLVEIVSVQRDERE